MAYATLQDLIDRFGEKELVQRTDRTNRPPTTIDATVAGEALEGASSLADGYLAKVFALPLPSTPRVLLDKVCDVARYFLRDQTADDKSAVARNYRDAIAWLRDVSTGVVKLDVGAGVAPEPAGGGAVRSTAGERVFTPDSLRNF
ncbi:MAG: DUF1320 domain-containing protein [Microbacterium sp.]|nr:MAG: DUF1320 domain-containing protein [Microbacterium sp.]